jgi:sugar (pentulose or hexulose) kinase
VNPKAPDVVLSVDVGGSGVKVSAFDMAQRRSLGQVTSAYDPRSWSRDRGTLDLDSWWITIASTLATLLEKLHLGATAVSGITVAAARIPFVLLDSDSRIIRHCIANTDRRATAEAARLAEDFGNQLYERTGHWAAPEFGLAKVLWLQAHEPETLARAVDLLQLHDWIIFQLCGARVSEPSSAAMSQMVDPITGAWATQLVEELGISTTLLPEMRAAGSKAGGLSKTVADRIGLAAGVPVYVGGGDTQLSALGANSLAHERPLVVVAGSTAPVQLVTSTLPSTAASSYPLLVSPHLLPGRWTYEANAGVIGALIRPLFGLVGQSGARLRTSLLRLGFQLGDADGGPTVLIGNPDFCPEGWRDARPPAVLGLREEHTGTEVLMAALQGSCVTLAGIFAAMRSQLSEESRPVVATGGMSVNPRWAQTLADVLGAEVSVPDATTSAGIAGASIVSGESVAALSLRCAPATRYLPGRRDRRIIGTSAPGGGDFAKVSYKGTERHASTR